MTRLEMYRTLGLPANASMDAVKESYRRLVKKYHPDLSGTAGSEVRLAKVILAYKNLTVAKRNDSIVDFPVKNRAKQAAPAAEREERKEIDIFKLGDLLENGKTVGMRAFAARSLGNSGKKTAYAFLRKGLSDTDDLVVKASVEAIAQLRIRQSYGELSALYARGGREIREAVVAAVAYIGPEGGFKEILKQAAGDPDITIRISAARMLNDGKKAVPNG